MNIFDEELVIVIESGSYAPVQAVNGKIGWVTIDKNDVGLSNVENISISGVSGYLQSQINNISGSSGSGVTGDFYPNSNPNNFISSNPPSGVTSLDLLIKYVTGVPTGISSYEGVFPNIYFTENPVVFISLSYENTQSVLINDILGKNRYLFDLTYRNQTGFGVVFSNVIVDTGINLNVLAYGKGIKL